MKLLIGLCFSVAFLLILGCSNNSNTQVDIQNIKRSPDIFDAAVNAGDYEALASLYLEDAVRMPPHKPAWVGFDAIRAGFKENFEQNDVVVDNTAEDVRVFGDWAIMRGIASVTITPKNGGDAIQDTSKWMGLWNRQDDGSWKIASDIFNSDLPESSAAPAASVPVSNGNVEKHLETLSDGWSQVVLTNDISLLERIWSPGFSYINSDGGVMNKREGIAERKSNSNTYTDQTTTNFKVRRYQSDFAVTTGDYKVTGRDKDGKAFVHKSRFTNVWVRKNGVWQCVSGHSSDLN